MPLAMADLPAVTRIAELYLLTLDPLKRFRTNWQDEKESAGKWSHDTSVATDQNVMNVVTTQGLLCSIKRVARLCTDLQVSCGHGLQSLIASGSKGFALDTARVGFNSMVPRT